MLKNMYASVMDENVNPLRTLPKIVRFQLMITLATLWSGVFAIWSGMIALAGPSMLVHSILLIGIYFTADIFKMADKKSPSNHLAAYRDPKDGCSRYDDLWGA